MIVRSRAPLRLSFGGGGTELAPYVNTYGGQILNATINLFAYTTLTKSTTGNVVFESKDKGNREEYDLAERYDVEKSALPLHCGVYNYIVQHFNHGKPLPVEVTTFCEAPVGSGLGASSTVTVAMIKAFDEYLNLALGEYDIAKMAYLIERVELLLSGGLQDQYAAAFGGFNFIDVEPDDRIIVNPLRVKDWIISELEASLILYYTGTSRESANIIVDQTEQLLTNNENVLSHMHKIKAYAMDMKEHLLKGNLKHFASVLHESWQAKKATSKKISNPHIDALYEKARSAGVLGGKVSGAGGGGFMMLLCEPSCRTEVLSALDSEVGHIFSATFSHAGAASWRVRD